MGSIKKFEKLILAISFAVSTQIGGALVQAAPDFSRMDPDDKNGGQVLEDSNGNEFMEEVVSDKPKPKVKKQLVPIDLSRVGVSVDPHGNIVPLKDDASDPWAGSGVKPFYNHIETSTTMPYSYGIGFPGAGVPGYGYPGFTYPGLGYPGFAYTGFGYPGYGFRGYGYPGYGYPGFNRFGGYGGFGPFNGYGGPSRRGLLGAALAGAGAALYSQSTGLNPAFNPAFGGPFQSPFYGGYGGLAGYGGYLPLGGGYVTTGNSATFLSNDLTTGAPLSQNAGSNSAGVNTSSTGSVTPLPWLSPTTSYQQNSMWKAFNLGF